MDLKRELDKSNTLLREAVTAIKGKSKAAVLLRFRLESQIVDNNRAIEQFDYDGHARSDAAEFVNEFIDQIVTQLIDDNKASDDYNNDYSGGDAYHHESHIDRSYDLQDSAIILDQLSEHVETDSGLWDGIKDPNDAIGAMAAYTYGNAVSSYWRDIIQEINSQWETIVDDLDEEAESCEARRDQLEALEGLDGCPTDEQVHSLEKLKATAGHDSEDAVDARRKAKAEWIVKLVAKSWETGESVSRLIELETK